jgi:hypothetical protein
MYLLLRWSRTGWWLTALGAGLLLGYAVTIRYTEGLLLLPMALAVALAWSDERGRLWTGGLAMAGGWLLPVGALVTFNLFAFGAITGYDPTNESTGFRFEYFVDNWETMLRHVDTMGMLLLFPLAIVGLVSMFWWHWRLALLLASWIVPALLVYTFYYWAPDGWGIGYMRFFLTVLPALAVAAFALLAYLMQSMPAARPAWVAATGVLVALGLLAQLNTSVPQLEVEQLNRLALLEKAEGITRRVPPGSVLFSRDRQLLHHLQFVADYRLYSDEPFNWRYVQRLENADPDEPQALQPQRALALYELLKDRTGRELVEENRRLVRAWLERSTRVFAVVPNRPQPWRRRRPNAPPPYKMAHLLPPAEYDVTLVTGWGQPAMGRFAAPDDRRVPRRRGPRPPRIDPMRAQWQMVEVMLRAPAVEQTAAR